jgi:hypothetical protein
LLAKLEWELGLIFGTGFKTGNWIFFSPTESSMMVSNQPDSWLHLCLEPRFVKRKEGKKKK